MVSSLLQQGRSPRGANVPLAAGGNRVYLWGSFPGCLVTRNNQNKAKFGDLRANTWFWPWFLGYLELCCSWEVERGGYPSGTGDLCHGLWHPFAQLPSQSDSVGVSQFKVYVICTSFNVDFFLIKPVSSISGLKSKPVRKEKARAIFF